MPTIGDRLKVLRKSLDLTQVEFCSRLGINKSTYSKYEINGSSPTDAVIKTVCFTFGVSEPWLRTGEGSMYAERSRDEELTFQMSRLLRSDDVEGRALIRFVFSLQPEQRAVVMEYARRLLAMQEAEEAERKEHGE